MESFNPKSDFNQFVFESLALTYGANFDDSTDIFERY